MQRKKKNKERERGAGKREVERERRLANNEVKKVETKIGRKDLVNLSLKQEEKQQMVNIHRQVRRRIRKRMS